MNSASEFPTLNYLKVHLPPMVTHPTLLVKPTGEPVCFI
jgi:hypothetical protein